LLLDLYNYRKTGGDMSDQIQPIQYKKCPYCAEEDLRLEAIVCKHCGRDLVNLAYPISQPPLIEGNQKKSTKWVFIVAGVFVLLAIPLCILGNILLPKNPTPTPIPYEQVKQMTLAAMVQELKLTNQPQQVVQPTPQPLPTIQPTQENDLGKSRNSPIPLNSEKNIGDMSFAISGVTRPADAIVASGNMFNTKPEPTQEYLMIEARSVCLKDASKKCSFDPSEFKAVGSDGNVIRAEYVVSGVPGQFDYGETFGGSTKVGRLFFLVPKGDPGVVIFYEATFFGTPTFFAIR
jgi:hypothetical protein